MKETICRGKRKKTIIDVHESELDSLFNLYWV